MVGDVSPGGKLPFTWPRTVGQVPMTYAHTTSDEPQNQGRYWAEESTPLYPFGFELGYGRLSTRLWSSIGGSAAYVVSTECDRLAGLVDSGYVSSAWWSAAHWARYARGPFANDSPSGES
ncbi:glycoside hydrolase family 3 C-terminal domain-containing protein [Micromonospora sp. C51]|nr:glycoside hydrolase family 3 C-terminal domain-containing protein [Micromonospora sp. C51]